MREKVIARLILHTSHNMFPPSQLHGFSENKFFKIFLAIVSSNGSVSHFGFSSHSSGNRTIWTGGTSLSYWIKTADLFDVSCFQSQCRVVLPCGAQPCAVGNASVVAISMSWLCSCIPFSISTDYLLCKIMMEFLWLETEGSVCHFLT